MRERCVETMLRIAEQIGRITMRLIADSRPTLKPDQSVLTRADVLASRLIKKELAVFLKKRGHMLIDEEDGQNAASFDQNRWEETPYIWVVDPVDGTRAFSNQLPLFGISIGLLKERRPWLGAVYFPFFRELFYHDGNNGYFVKNAFCRGRQKRRIQPVHQRITRQSLLLVSDSFFQLYDWDFDFCQVTLPSCAVIDLCWPAIGRGCGCFFNAHLWDFAGAWPIFREANLELRTVATGDILQSISTDLFQGRGSRMWRLKEPYILSSNRNYSRIKAHLKPRSSHPSFSTEKEDFKTGKGLDKKGPNLYSV